MHSKPTRRFDKEILLSIIHVSAAALTLALLTACQTQSTRSPEAAAADAKVIASRDSAFRELVGATPRLVAEFRTLTERQRAAVVSLVLISNAAARYERSAYPADTVTAAAMLGQVEGLLAVRPRVSARSILGACMSESIAYASAMVSCPDEFKKTEQECPDAQGAAGALAACQLKAMLALKGYIGDLFGRIPGPGPRPFPY